MSRVSRALFVVAAAVLATLGLVAVADAAHSIRANQHFRGKVNGASAAAVVYTECPGPVVPGRTGPAIGGQTMSIVRGKGAGYTGPFSQIYAWFVPMDATAPTQLTFTGYRAPQEIPSSIQVPCEGTGQVEFSSCPYAAPCAAGWVPDFVDVTFIDIAD